MSAQALHSEAASSPAASRTNTDVPGNVVALATEPGGSPLDTAWQQESALALPAALVGPMTRGRSGAFCLVSVRDYRVTEGTFGPRIWLLVRELVEQRLRSALRAKDVVARVADDEFGIVLDGITLPEDLVGVAERLVARTQGVYAVDGFRLQVGVNLGLARYPADGSDPGELLRRARLALHVKEPQDILPYKLYAPQLLETLRERVRLATELDGALAQQRLVLHYQPLFEVPTQKTVGAEALLRLRSCSGELIAPGRFIALAESMGLIVPIGRWVIREACRQLGAWHRQGLGPLKMSINVSPQQLADRQLVEVVDRAVERAGIHYSDLILEITEGEMLQNLALAEQVFVVLSARGVQIAVDDFGTGYSALAYLARLPLHTVKIDRAFLAKVPVDPKSASIVAAVTALAKKMGLTVTAEGVETEEQYRFLVEVGCELGQGFGFARPGCAEAFTERLQAPPPWRMATDG